MGSYGAAFGDKDIFKLLFAKFGAQAFFKFYIRFETNSRDLFHLSFIKKRKLGDFLPSFICESLLKIFASSVTISFTNQIPCPFLPLHPTSLNSHLKANTIIQTNSLQLSNRLIIFLKHIFKYFFISSILSSLAIRFLLIQFGYHL